MTTNWFAVIDGAQDVRLAPLVRSTRDHACLFAGTLAPELETAAPGIARIDPAEQLLPTWQVHGKGLNWGIMIEAQVTMAEVRNRLRRFLQAKLPDGMIALFRFYDPRVFNTYIYAASADERARWFDGGIVQYAVEGIGGTTHQYRLRGGQLVDGHDVVD